MKIIFLDVDGVLNNKDYLLSTQDALSLDPSCVDCLRRLIKSTGAKVVLSSSWRHSKRKIKYLENTIKIKFYDILPDLHERRGNEINAWLKNHKEVSKYIILDDEDFDIRDKNLIKTNFYESGLNGSHVIKGIKVLNSKGGEII